MWQVVELTHEQSIGRAICTAVGEARGRADTLVAPFAGSVVCSAFYALRSCAIGSKVEAVHTRGLGVPELLWMPMVSTT